jgi:ribulose-phosphate 3-epimerase
MANRVQHSKFKSAHISASIMCGNLGALGEEAKKLEDAGVDSLHIDVMDGHFVPNLTFGPGTVSAVRRATQLPLHVHMMVRNPSAHVRPFAESGAELFYFHVETEPHPLRLSSAITESGMTAGVAINPFTPLAAVVDLPLAHVLVMSVEPGFAGQRWVDGNVTEDNAVLAYENGASLFVCGTSSIFASDDYASAVGQMRSKLRAVQDSPLDEGRSDL